MSESNDLIERMERETGQRIDDNGGDNNAMAGLIGAMARLMGKTAHTRYADDPKMDVPVGMYLKATSTPEYLAAQKQNEALAEALINGANPADLYRLLR